MARLSVSLQSRDLHVLLRANREAAGLSQGALAAPAGTTQSVVARAESNIGPLDDVLRRTLRICDGQTPDVDDRSRAACFSVHRGIHHLARRTHDAATAHGIDEVRVVGSVARGTARTDSDVDLLVTVSSRLRGARYFTALDAFREACVRIMRRPIDIIDQARLDCGLRALTPVARRSTCTTSIRRALQHREI